MNIQKFSLTLTVLVSVATSVFSQDRGAPLPFYRPEFEDSNPDYFFEAGTRILYVELLDDSQGSTSSGSFIGSITGLDVHQNFFPDGLFVQILFPRDSYHFGFGMSCDQMSVATVDPGGGDGDIDMISLQTYLVVAYTEKDVITPYGEIGVAFYNNSFDEDAGWSDNGKRSFDLDNSIAPYLAVGCAYNFNEKWSMDLYLRYVNVDVDGAYELRGDGKNSESFTFTLEHLATGVGVKYVF